MKKYKLRIPIVLYFILSWIISAGFILFWIDIAISRPEDLTDTSFIGASILFLILVGPPIILTITYFLEDLRKNVIIDDENEIIKIKKGNIIVDFNKKDLLEVYHVKVNWNNSSKFQFTMYRYLLFVFKEKKKLVITNLICKPEIIINALKINPKIVYKNIPFIDRKMGNSFLTSEELDSKINEFYIKYKNKEEDELLRICKQPGYAEYAKKAARLILDDIK